MLVICVQSHRRCKLLFVHCFGGYGGGGEADQQHEHERLSTGMPRSYSKIQVGGACRMTTVVTSSTGRYC